MATKIIHKKSSVASSVPSAGDLEPGEIAVNLADQKLYSKTTAGAVIELAPSGAASTSLTESCKNVSGGSLSIGTPVYQSGTAGNAMEVQKALSGTAASMPAVGLLSSTLADEAEGTIVLSGFLQGLNTSTFSEGDTLYVSATGTLTTTIPAGEANLIQNIGKVIKVHASNGSIMVTGAGRSNATPNLNDGNIFIGNGSNQSSTVSFNATVDAHLNQSTANTGEVLSWDGTDYDWVSAGGSSYLVKTTTYTAVAGDSIIANTSGGVFTITLPASPSAGDTVVIADGNDWATNNLTVARNGSTIEGDAEDMTMDLGGVNSNFVYDGATWQVYAHAGITSSLQAYVETEFTATASQTTFTVDYTAGKVDVHLNGVKLANADYAATNGTTIVLTTAAAVNDILNVVAWNSFTPANVATSAQGALANSAIQPNDSPTFVTVNATTVDLGDWTVTESSGSLYFATGGTNKMKLDASGNLDVVGDVNSNATIT
jgi:hypothetical protein